MFNSRGLFRFSLVAAAAAFLTIAGCSNQATNEATNQPPAPPKKADAGKSGAKPAAAKPAAKKAEPAKAATAKNAAAKPVAVSNKTVSGKPASSKVTQPTTFVTVPQGTEIRATVGQALASNKNHSGDSFAAILSSPIKVDGKTVIPKGAHVTGRVVTAQKKSPPQLTVALASVDVDGKSYKLVTDPINRGPKTQAKSDASGDAAKAKEKDISLAAETRLKFKLAKPVKIPVKG
jgi:hypothetical protein